MGGQAVQDGQWHDGPTSRYVATYTDIVERARIVSTYDMWVGGGHLSTSLTTTEFTAVEGGTRLTYTEQGVFLDGQEDGSQREAGFQGIFDVLADVPRALTARQAQVDESSAEVSTPPGGVQGVSTAGGGVAGAAGSAGGASAAAGASPTGWSAAIRAHSSAASAVASTR